MSDVQTPETLNVGIICDPYKVKLFKKRLKEAGYSFALERGEQRCLFSVKTAEPLKLQRLIEKTNTEAAASRAQKH